MKKSKLTLLTLILSTSIISNSEFGLLGANSAFAAQNVNQTRKEATASNLQMLGNSYSNGYTSTGNFDWGYTSATSTPSSNRYTTSTPSSNRYATSTPSTNRYATSTPSSNRYTISTPGTNRYTTSIPGTNRYTTSTPSTNGYAANTPNAPVSTANVPTNTNAATAGPTASNGPTNAPYPAIKSVTVESATEDSITLKIDSTNITSYTITYTDNSKEATITSTSPTCTLSNLKAGSRYSINVVGKVANKIEDSKTLETSTKITKLSHVENDKWYHLLEKAHFSWERQNAADGYECQLLTLKGKLVKSQKLTSVFLSNTSFSIKNNIIYRFRIRPYQTKNGKTTYTAWSECLGFEQPWVTKFTKTKNGLYIKWEKQIGATKYDIYISNKGKKAKTFKKVATVKANKTSYVLKKFKKKKIKGSNYTVYVVSKLKYNGKTSHSGRVYLWKLNNPKEGYIN